MIFSSDPLWGTVFVILAVCWAVFWGAFIFRKRPPQMTERKRDPASVVGIVLQALAYSITFWLFRFPFRPTAPLGMPLELTLAIASIVLAVGPMWLVIAAIRTLGKQWTLTARVLQGHKLVTEGPYQLVRNREMIR